MLTSDLAIKFNTRVGYITKSKIDFNKLLDLSKEIYKSFLKDNE